LLLRHGAIALDVAGALAVNAGNDSNPGGGGQSSSKFKPGGPERPGGAKRPGGPLKPAAPERPGGAQRPGGGLNAAVGEESASLTLKSESVVSPALVESSAALLIFSGMMVLITGVT